MTTHGLSSLEAPFLWALFTIRRVREHLNVSPNLAWKFVSTAILQKPKQIDAELAQQILRQQGIVCFNVGHAEGVGAWDQHGTEDNRSLCQKCSLDIVRDDHDFLNHRPWLREVYDPVRKNDTRGERLSAQRANIRLLMDGLGVLYPEQPMLRLETLGLAFLGVFERAKAGISIEQVFNLDQIKIGVAEHNSGQTEEFNQRVDQARKAMETAERQAKRDVKKAEQGGNNIRVIEHPVLSDILGRKIRILLVHSDSTKAAAITRWRKFDLAVVTRSDSYPWNGHCQIFSSTMWQKDSNVKWRFNLGWLAHRLRILEARFAGKRLERGSWSNSGFVYYENDQPDNIGAPACPWYVPEFWAAAFNGSKSSWDVPKSAIHPPRILRANVENLPKCGLLRQEDDGDWDHYNG